MRRARDLTRSDSGRYIDYGVRLRIVCKDEDAGQEVIPGKPGVWDVSEPLAFGGVWDTAARKWVDRKTNRIVWYCSEAQLAPVIHDRCVYPKSRVLCYGAEGAGKTEVLAMHGLLKTLAIAGTIRGIVYAGVTAPTSNRLKTVRQAVMRRCPIDSPMERRDDAWGTYYAKEDEIRFHCGVTWQFRSTAQRSRAEGSPLQGYSWAFHLGDEAQDQLSAHEDIEARLRGVKGTTRFCTATAKDSPAWRDHRDALVESGVWQIARLPYDSNAFEWDERWANMRANLSQREVDRRMLALDVMPERAVYHTWERKKNVMMLPAIGARDVTRRVLERFGRFDMLIGHDPGSILDVSVCLRAYMLPGRKRHVWYVVDEVTTTSTTTEQHCTELLSRLRSRHGMQVGDDPDGRVLVMADPQSENEAREQPHKSVYRVFRRKGLKIMSASPVNNRVPKEAGIQMVVSMICNADGERRLYVDVDQETLKPVAPGLVRAFEGAKRDAEGKAEMERKSDKTRDLSDHPASTRYALWRLEREGAPEVNLGVG